MQESMLLNCFNSWSSFFEFVRFHFFEYPEKLLHRQVHAGIGVQIESARPGMGVIHPRGVSTCTCE